MEYSDRAAAERLEALRRELAPVRRSLDRIGGADPSAGAAAPLRREAVEPLVSAEIAARADTARREGSPFPVAGVAPPGSLPGSLVEALARVRAREVSPEELGSEALARAEAASGLGAFLEIGDAPLTAGAADRREGAVADLPLGGLPLTLKDIFDAAGWTTTSGSRFPVRAEADSWAWGRLAAAGAALLGKTNLNEWAFGVDGGNLHFGPTRNPHDPERIVGGSSSGSAASLAAGIGYGSLGSDTGGSIRIPAALTGIFGLKPTWGRLSRAGVTPLSWSLDHIGPMARSAADLGLLWSVLSGESGSGGAPEEGASPGAVAPGRPLAGLTAGVPEDFFFDDLTPEAGAAAERVVRGLEEIGVRRAPVRIPEIELAGVCRTVIAFAEAAAFHRRRLSERPDHFGGGVRLLLTAGAGLTAEEVLTALRGRRLVTDAVSRSLEAADFLVVPTTPAGAPRLGDALLDTGEDLRAGLMRLVGPFDLTGHPALQVPAGRDRNAMPLGAQLVGPHGGESLLLRAARELEAAGAGGSGSAGAPPPGCYIPPDAARR